MSILSVNWKKWKPGGFRLAPLRGQSCPSHCCSLWTECLLTELPETPPCSVVCVLPLSYLLYLNGLWMPLFLWPLPPIIKLKPFIIKSAKNQTEMIVQVTMLLLLSTHQSMWSSLFAWRSEPRDGDQMHSKDNISGAINLLLQLTKTWDTFYSLHIGDVEEKVEKPMNYSSKDVSSSIDWKYDASHKCNLKTSSSYSVKERHTWN